MTYFDEGEKDRFVNLIRRVEHADLHRLHLLDPVLDQG